MFAWLKSFRRRDFQYPPGPDGVVVYAVGDVHGRSDCLERAHQMIDRDVAERGAREQALEVYVGDYVDRGPNAKGVIDLLIARSALATVVALRGNHEILMESFLRGLTPFEDWRRLGGLETVLSYGVDARKLLANGGIHPRDVAEKIPVSHLRFLSSLRGRYTIGRYCFVHAGLRPGVPLERQTIEDLVWIRDDFLKCSDDFGFVVVHGHTPMPNIEFFSNRINIDTGAYMTNRLSVLRIDGQGVTPLEPWPG
ncbi:MAG TPA: metallophosphoesterase family protein [Roseiarcus sp.]